MDEDCWRSGFGGLASKQAQKEEDVIVGEREVIVAATVHQQPTPPDSYPRKEITTSTPPDIMLAESDSEDTDRTLLAIHTDQVARSAIRAFGQIAGKKRARSASSLDDEDSARRVRCRPAPIERPYILRSHSRFLKAN